MVYITLPILELHAVPRKSPRGWETYGREGDARTTASQLTGDEQAGGRMLYCSTPCNRPQSAGMDQGPWSQLARMVHCAHPLRSTIDAWVLEAVLLTCCNAASTTYCCTMRLSKLRLQ